MQDKIPLMSFMANLKEDTLVITNLTNNVIESIMYFSEMKKEEFQNIMMNESSYIFDRYLQILREKKKEEK